MNDHLLHTSFSKKVVNQPNHIAFRAKDISLTFKDLDNASSYLSDQLLKLKVRPNELVVVLMEQGWEQIIAVLAILKAGAAFLPIEASDPEERLKHLLSLSKSKVIITQERFVSKLKCIECDDFISINKKILEKTSTHRYFEYQKEEDLAYVIFTSGSTGNPKGVMIAHKAVCNTIEDINHRFQVSSKDRIFSASRLIFDLAIYDIFGALSAGASIVFGGTNFTKDITQWEQLFFAEHVTVWNSVPSLMDVFIDYLSAKHSKLPQHSLRLVLLSGDWIPLALPKRIWSLFGNQVQIISLGGATEGSIWSILYPIKHVSTRWKSIPYGKPMQNQSFHILDKHLKPVSRGKPGELYIGGMGVARGYWGDKLLTQKSFINHPSYGYIYKTGDLGKYLPDGNIEFLGRVDFQVKVSGYRVEPRMIEKTLTNLKGVKQAIVVPIKHNKRETLAAYLTLEESFYHPHLVKVNQQKKIIKEWQKVYDALFKENVNKKNTKLKSFNTTGWVDSFIGKKISNVQMSEWLDNTIDRIESLSPKRVLEIGFGTGLILFKLIDKVQAYAASDFSKKAVDNMNNQLASSKINNANILHLAAHETKLIAENYDIVILNSVVQYFPNLSYLEDVINQCISKIADDGHIFIGDIRSLKHLQAFYALKLLISKTPKNLNYQDWLNVVNLQKEDEEELVIDHEYFYELQSKNPKITGVEIHIKNGQYHNEMNCFRYDVILHVNRPKPIKQSYDWIDASEDEVFICTIEDKLKKRVKNLAIKNIPNKRIIGLNKLTSYDLLTETHWPKKLKKYLTLEKKQAIDPAKIYCLAKNYDYNIFITWSKENAVGCFDVILSKHEIDYGSVVRERPIDISRFANEPTSIKFKQMFIEDVNKQIKSKLPAHMIPKHICILKNLPITSNGKLDRKALPKIFRLSNTPKVLPKNIIEKKLKKIWETTLGIGNLSTRDNFMNVGGTSLLAVQLLININSAFKTNYSLEDINFGEISIVNVAQRIAKSYKEE